MIPRQNQNRQQTLMPGENSLRHTTRTTLTATPALQPGAALSTARAVVRVRRCGSTIKILEGQPHHEHHQTHLRHMRGIQPRMKPIIEARAKAQQLRKPESVSEISHEQTPSIRTDEAVANLASMSSNTIRKIEQIENEAAPEL